MNATQRLQLAGWLKQAAISQAGGLGILRKLKARGVPVFRKPGFEGAPAGYWGANSFVDKAKLTNGEWLDYIYVPKGVKTPLDDLAHEAGHIFQPKQFRPRTGSHGREKLMSEVSANGEAVNMLPMPDRSAYLKSVAPDYRTYKVTESTVAPALSSGNRTMGRFSRMVNQSMASQPDTWKLWTKDNAQAIPFNKAVRRQLEKTDTQFARQYRKFMLQNRDLLQRPA